MCNPFTLVKGYIVNLIFKKCKNKISRKYASTLDPDQQKQVIDENSVPMIGRGEKRIIAFCFFSFVNIVLYAMIWDCKSIIDMLYFVIVY
jgi:hypothetical protein